MDSWGSGVGLLYNKCYKIEKQDVTSFLSFEYMEVLPRSATTVLRIGILYWPPPSTNNDYVIMCHVTEYSTILGVFQQPWPGVSPIRHFERGEGPGDEIVNQYPLVHLGGLTDNTPHFVFYYIDQKWCVSLLSTVCSLSHCHWNWWRATDESESWSAAFRNW